MATEVNSEVVRRRKCCAEEVLEEMSQEVNWLPYSYHSQIFELPNDGSGFEMCAYQDNS